jgi:hypothetical protein
MAPRVWGHIDEQKSVASIVAIHFSNWSSVALSDGSEMSRLDKSTPAIRVDGVP